ncbi:hypothetical protein A9Q87_05275 [Flavobacteriales bacterium 34_180_T64]|nr:hypothetical protein A9Q87_05275 [Flavobacteriales bacterium 34_180_T64]
MISAIAHKIMAFILVFILFAHNINTLVIIGDFIVNQDFIAKTLCIQKEKQQGCNGKCQLRKELKGTNSNSGSDLPFQESKRLSLDVFCITTIDALEFPSICFGLSQKETLYTTHRVSKLYLEIDTPPPNFS